MPVAERVFWDDQHPPLDVKLKPLERFRQVWLFGSEPICKPHISPA